MSHFPLGCFIEFRELFQSKYYKKPRDFIKTGKKTSRRVLSAGLDFHNHSGASSLLSVTRFNRKRSLKIQSFFSTCQPVGAESNVKTDGSRLVKGQGVAGSKKKRGTILCMDVLSLSTQLSFQCSDRYNVFSPGNSPLQWPFQHRCSAAHPLLKVRWTKPPNEMDTGTKSSASSAVL